MGSRLRALATGALLLGVTACAGIPAPPALSPAQRLVAWDLHQHRLAQVSGWALSGRVAVRDPAQSWSASIRWAQHAEGFVLRLSGPLGQGLAELSGDDHAVRLRAASGEEYTAKSAAALLRERVGWTLPVSGLRYWVLGRPDPETAARSLALDDQGRLRGFAQDGWNIRIGEYRDFGGLALPVALEFEGAEISASLRIRRWRIDAGSGA